MLSFANLESEDNKCTCAMTELSGERIPVKVTQDISESPIKFQRGSRKYPG